MHTMPLTNYKVDRCVLSAQRSQFIHRQSYSTWSGVESNLSPAVNRPWNCQTHIEFNRYSQSALSGSF